MTGHSMMVLLLVSAFYVVQSMPSYSVPDKPQTFCGKHLDDAVALACGYKNHGKRSARNNWNWNYEYDEENASSDDAGGSVAAIRSANRFRFPLFQKDSQSIGDLRIKKTPGIVQECCKSPCSLNYIAEWYC